MSAMATVLVTGGAGFIGSHTCKALAAQGLLPVAFDDLSKGHAELVRWGPLEQGDILNSAHLDAAFARHRPSVQVALVENVTGSPAGVEIMDYVETGKIITLGSGDTIVLSYMGSCVRETITGGTVTIGIDQSEVQAGKVARTKVQCDAGKMLFAGDQAVQFGGRIFRSVIPFSASDSNPQLTLYGQSPIVELTSTGTLLVDRLDQASERDIVDLENEQLLHGRFYDFAKRGKNLAAGGIYRMSFRGQEIVFKIDARAQPGNTPILGRLLRFVPPS